ncbi:hypothetical protein JK232_01670 [Nissabacter archeti]|uniref:Uncharacterized protein n=1 Tax=Nissabacter archeti TaxID=1917880 RepID=A0ABS5JCB8_9GAMM|nr:hypothetical protein [Nissabacter archeti]MBS0967595.1 hypothetical protein [Nissabacter archeti]
MTQASITQLHRMIAEVNARLASRTATNRALNLTTYALTLGLGASLATGASLTSHSSQLLVLSAAAAYGANTLFFPPTVEGAYLGAGTVLSCLAMRGNNLMAAYQQAKMAAPPKTAYCPDADKINAAWHQLQTTLNTTEAGDSGFGATLTDAQNNVIQSLNLQLLSANPSPEAILASAKSSLAAVAGVVTPAALSASKSKDTKPALFNELNFGETCALANPAQTLANLTRLNDHLNQQINLIGALDTHCLAADRLVLPLTTLNSTIILSKDEKQTLAFSGGKPPFTLAWQGKVPAAEVIAVSVESTSRTVRLERLAGNVDKDTEVTLQLSDSNILPQRLLLTIKLVP